MTMFCLLSDGSENLQNSPLIALASAVLLLKLEDSVHILTGAGATYMAQKPSSFNLPLS
jgi:hypothetical protein